MYLALTYDHRLLDGREAVTFLVKVCWDINHITEPTTDSFTGERVYRGPSTHAVGLGELGIDIVPLGYVWASVQADPCVIIRHFPSYKSSSLALVAGRFAINHNRSQSGWFR